MTDLRPQLDSALSSLRCVYLETRNHIEHCRTLSGKNARPEHWFETQQARLKDYEFAGAEFGFIVANWESYAKWRESVGSP